MKYSALDTSFGEELTATFAIEGAERVPASVLRSEATVERGDDNRLFLIAHGAGRRWPVNMKGRRARRFLDTVVDSGVPALVFLDDVSGRDVVLRARLVPLGVRSVTEGVGLTLDMRLRDDLSALGYHGDATDVVRRHAVLDEPGMSGVFVESESARRGGGYTIHGSGICFEVRLERQSAFVFRAFAAPRNRPSLAFLRGDVVLSDQRQTLSEQALAQLKGVKLGSGFLAGWERYNNVEWELAVARAERAGAVRYAGVPRRENRWERSYLVFELRDALPDGLLAMAADGADGELMALDRTGLAELGLGLADYYAFHSSAQSEPVSKKERARHRLLRGKRLGVLDPVALVGNKQEAWVRIDDSRGRVASAVGAPKDGWLAVSLSGAVVALERRTRALACVRTRTARIPDLLALIESEEPVIRPQRRAAGQVDTPAVRRILGGKPDDEQKKALRVALRTPDIALILGPPGTGKTRIIQALVHLLGDGARGRAGAEAARSHVLLSAQSHDAVDEQIGGASLAGVPVLRVGSGDHVDMVRLAVAANFADEVAEQASSFAESLPADPSEAALSSARRALRRCEAAAGHGDAAAPRRLIAELETILSPHLDSAQWSALDAAWRSLAPRGTKAALALAPQDRQDLIAAAAGLRTSPEAFADDGPARAAALAELVRDLGVPLAERLKEALDAAARARRPVSPDILASLGAVRDELTDSLDPGDGKSPADIAPAVEVSRSVLRAIEARIQRGPAGQRRALREFAREIGLDLPGTADAISEYATGLGATCSFSARVDVPRDDGGFGFDVVVVDEAARANPLDVLVAITLGYRVILVGDPYQLPPILEAEVERELEAAGNADAKELLGRSLFEVLWERFDAWREQDAPPRVADVRRQFRMHPRIGRFISGEFYEGKLSDGVAAEERQHKFKSFEGEVAAWVDVPVGAGPEESDEAGSRYRAIEAREVVRIVELLQEEDPEARIGVVTFYKAQAALLATELGVPMGDDGPIRVGTVDAFQGRQFDAVVLSPVRANRKRPDDPDDFPDRLGFLGLKNRLNVALSRVKALQVVVGCLDTLTGDPNATACGPLKEFFKQLCAGRTYAQT